MCEICDNNTSKEKYEKLRNYLFKMKELSEIALRKVPPQWKLFLTFLIQI